MSSVQSPIDKTTPPTEEKRIREQKRYLFDNYTFILLIALLLLILTIGLGGLFFLLKRSAYPLPTFFAATQAGQIIQEPPLEDPNININVLLNWITEALMNMHTFNFITYNTVMANALEYFTPEGYKNYQEALTNLKIIDRVITNKLILKTTALDAPQILLDKAFAGRYMWKVKIPLRFRYQNATSNNFDNMAVTIIVMRVPTSQSSAGVSILRYDLEALPRDFAQ